LNNQLQENSKTFFAGMKEDTAQASLEEKVKQLEKENYLLKEQVNNKFNKQMIRIEEQLSDAEREKRQLSESKRFMEERCESLEQKMKEMIGKSQNSEELKSFREELQLMVSKQEDVIKQRDSYLT